jgi:hypothetical protein
LVLAGHSDERTEGRLLRNEEDAFSQVA